MNATSAPATQLSRSPIFTVGVVSLLATLGMFIAYPAIDPATGWNDHYFYWGQANTWFGLNQPLQLSPDVQALLDKYRVDYYYEVANGESLQPPYVYRPAVPVLAGIVGIAVPLWLAFLGIAVTSFLILGIASGLAVHRLTSSLTASGVAALLAVIAPGLGTFSRFYAMVDVTAIAVTAAVIAFTVFRRWTWALVLAALVAPLVKETSVALAAFVALVMWLQGERGVLKWVAAAFPFAMLIGLRLLIQVPAPPDLNELYVPGSPYEGGHTFIEAFGFAFPLVIGLAASKVRVFMLASVPVIVTLLIVNSSVVATGERIWLAFWPFLVIFGLDGLMAQARTSIARGITLGLLLLGAGLANLVQLGYVDRMAITAWVGGTILALAALAIAQLKAPGPKSQPQRRTA